MNIKLTAFPTKISKYIFCLLFLSQGYLYAQTAEPLFEVSATKYLLGTEVDIAAVHSNINVCKKALYYAFQEIERIENLLSCHLKDSEISKINNKASIEPVKVSNETFSIIKKSIAYSKKFDGLFDISIGPITELWGFNDDMKITIPQKEKLISLLKLIDYKNIILNNKDTTVLFGAKGMKLDLGGIAKGYAIDRAVDVLKQKGIKHFLINAGGDIYAAGVKSKNKKWAIGVKHPRKPHTLLAKFELSDFAVATSGDYERYADIDGIRYHHIINPKTGYPSNLCQSVTVLASTAEEADVWATYLFIMGYNNYMNSVADSTVASIIIDSSGNINYDNSLERDFMLTFIE
ncbi:MAG: FAD:protein FMN transferase [bacterium]